MSTRSHIGYKDGDKVKFIYCHSDGYLSYNGVFLYLFYRNPEKVKALIELGDISCIGYNLAPPRPFNVFQEASTIHMYMNLHIKTSWVLAYNRDCGRGQQSDSPNTWPYNEYIQGGQAYNYLFDLKDNKWYVIKNVKGTPKLYALDTIFKNRKEFNLFKAETEDYGNFDEIQETIKDWKLDCTNSGDRTIINTYNNFLKEKKINNMEFDYVMGENGTRIYGLLYRKNPNSLRRTVWARGVCIGDLLYKLLQAQGKTFW